MSQQAATAAGRLSHDAQRLLESAIADDPQRAYAQRAPDELWDKAAAAESRQYLVETFRIPNPQRVDLEEHVLAGVA